MRLFSQRRSRSAKAATLTAATKLSGRLSGHLRNVDVLLRLAICAGFLVLMVGVLGSWRAPFRYRLGEYVADGILARIDFERVNLRKTELARLDRERLVAPIFRNDPEPLRELTATLRNDLFEVAAVHDPNDLAEVVRSAFGFQTSTTQQHPMPEAMQRDWEALRMVIGPQESKERTIDEIVDQFTTFTAPLRASGVLNPAEIGRHDLTLDRSISVMAADAVIDDQAPLETFPASQALLDESLKAGGRLAQQWNQFATLSRIQPILERWLRQRVAPTLVYDEESTIRRLRQVRDSTPQERDKYQRGQVLVPPGAWIDEETLDILRAQYDAIETATSWTDRAIRLAVSMALLLVLGGVMAYYLQRNEPRVVHHVGRMTVYLTTVTLAIGIGRLFSGFSWGGELVPILSAVMILAIAYNQVLAALTGFALALIMTLAGGGNVGDFVVNMSTVAAAVVPMTSISSRSKIVVVGFWTALTYFVVDWGMAIIRFQQLERLWTDWNLLSDSLSGATACFVTGLLVSGILPFVEQIFGVVTDLSLLELSDVGHPLLQELVRRAPGTYNHSIGVATIAETAADTIGANGLLCRVGAYFHDIGKMLKPQYFVENVSPGQESRHAHLNPAMSTLVIIGHVKDGADLAHQHNLPQSLIDFIEQHHGTTLVEYFFRAANKAAEAQPEEFRTVVEESAFRYPGPKPQTREAAVMMIADAVEGASRTLDEPTPKRLETLVHDIAMKRLLDGQFDESSLTLSELAIVEDSLTKSLIGIYHGRIKYPDQKSA
ncbi:MAG TPA: HDIG domain-containing protein [Planctomycetaceae bacterium]|nr:HDIG domain-containing protein [Planctomycetaceae bacterium]